GAGVGGGAGGGGAGGPRGEWNRLAPPGGAEPHRRGAGAAVAALEAPPFFLQREARGPPHRADVERLVACVQDEDPAAGQAAGRGYRYLAVRLPILHRVTAVLMGGLMAVGRNLCGGPVAHVPRDCRRGVRRPRRISRA